MKDEASGPQAPLLESDLSCHHSISRTLLLQTLQGTNFQNVDQLPGLQLALKEANIFRGISI